MLKSISVTNYRGFRGRTELEIRPITILLGKNSSGKSSLTRLIPLLQQSLERQSSSPILWASESVDLGGINDVINHGARDEPLEIGFRLTTSAIAEGLGRPSSFGLPAVVEEDSIDYRLVMRPDGVRTSFEGVDICIEDQRLTLRWDKDGRNFRALVNGSVHIANSDEYIVQPESIFPSVSRRLNRVDIQRLARTPVFYSRMRDALSYFIHKKTSSEKIDIMSRGFPYQPRTRIKDQVAVLPNVVKRRLADRSELYDLSDAALVNDIPGILRHLEYDLRPLFASSAYIGPSRASSSRFNRIQELAVNRLDSTGSNTAMYIYSLSDSELSSFNELMYRACGHIVRIQESGAGHVSLHVGQLGSGVSENIADVGFGFSQLVPVIAQLHAVLERPSGSEYFYGAPAILAVEQPELHLHPAMQANLADLFVEAVRLGGSFVSQLSLVIETHSESIVSQLARLVAEEEILPESIGLYFVEKDIDGISSLRMAEFDADGVVKGWPAGYFSGH